MTRPPRPPARDARPTGQVRIIGGEWRNTRLPVADVAGLRPTSDRVRETLFNWLIPSLPRARVLDAFAGTGALGLEAVSRGASSAVLVERDRLLADQLHGVVARLEAGERVHVVNANVLAWLGSREEAAFDIAFVDPPFAGDLWSAVLPAVARVLAPEGLLYVEAPADARVSLTGWHVHREGATRDVRFALWRRGALAGSAS